jgi:hypothetical protein
MKRIILLIALALLASACATTQAPTNTNTTTTPANANATATPKAEATTNADAITAQEKKIWDAIKNKDSASFAAMLADDFVYVSSDGVHDKAGTVDGIKELQITDLTLSDWKVLMLDKDAAVVTYTVNMKGTSGGEPFPSTPMRASSAWVNRGGKWVGVYHQDTEIKEGTTGQPSSSANSNQSAKTATPSEAKPAEASSDDLVAREKQIWDAIKKKDYDGFASFLADDQIEVWESGVNDKAASVAGVKQANLTSAVLSDFKTTKLNDNATLVTYVVKGSGDLSPTGERSSTIWARRGGQWLAAFHQGTRIQPAMAKK